jgi:hypothetical protein
MKDYREWKGIGDMSSDMMISSNPKIIARLPGSLQDAPLLLYSIKRFQCLARASPLYHND